MEYLGIHIDCAKQYKCSLLSLKEKCFHSIHCILAGTTYIICVMVFVESLKWYCLPFMLHCAESRMYSMANIALVNCCVDSRGIYTIEAIEQMLQTNSWGKVNLQNKWVV